MRKRGCETDRKREIRRGGVREIYLKKGVDGEGRGEQCIDRGLTGEGEGRGELSLRSGFPHFKSSLTGSH